MSSRSLRSTLPSEVKGAAWATVAIMLSMLTVATLDSRYHGSLHCVLVHEVLQAPLQAALGDDDEPAHVFLDERNVAIHGMTIGAPAWASSSSLRRSRGAQALERIELLGAPFAGQPDDDGDGDNELGDTLGHSSGQPASLLGSAARVPVNLVWKQRGHAVVLSMSSCGAIRAGNGGGARVEGSLSVLQSTPLLPNVSDTLFDTLLDEGVSIIPVWGCRGDAISSRPTSFAHAVSLIGGIGYGDYFVSQGMGVGFQPLRSLISTADASAKPLCFGGGVLYVSDGVREMPECHDADVSGQGLVDVRSQVSPGQITKCLLVIIVCSHWMFIDIESTVESAYPMHNCAQGIGWGDCAQVDYADWTYSVSDGFGRVKLIHAKKPKPKPVFHLTSSPPKDAIVFGLSEDDLIAAVQTRTFYDFVSHMSVTLLEILFQHELRVGPQSGACNNSPANSFQSSLEEGLRGYASQLASAAARYVEIATILPRVAFPVCDHCNKGACGRSGIKGACDEANCRICK